jgi:HEAT repeat protein
LRLSFAGDVSGTVRDAAGRALGRLGDADSVDTFCTAVHNRGEDHETAKTAAYALGYLGDVRGIDALVTAYEATWLPEVVSEALMAIGPAAIPFLIEVIERNPDLLRRTTARAVLDQLRAEALLPALLDRVALIAAESDFVSRATTLLDIAKDRDSIAKPLGAKILAVRPDLLEASSREERALARKAGATFN